VGGKHQAGVISAGVAAVVIGALIAVGTAGEEDQNRGKKKMKRYLWCHFLIL
jgi:hypothetical protein